MAGEDTLVVEATIKGDTGVAVMVLVVYLAAVVKSAKVTSIWLMVAALIRRFLNRLPSLR